MTLHLTVAFGPGIRNPLDSIEPGEPTAEFAVDTTILDTGAAIEDSLARTVGACDFTVAGSPLRNLKPHIPPLTNGAVVVAGADDVGLGLRKPAEPSVPALLLAVLTGPDAGQLTALPRGTYTLGREGTDIVVRDPEISRSHAVLSVGNDAVTLTDLNSANGTWVDGQRTSHASVTTSSALRFGRSQCRLLLGTQPQAAPAPDGPPEPLVVNNPAAPERARLQLAAALLPLFLGVVLALTTGMWFFLAFSALSAVTASFPIAAGIRRVRRFRAAVREAAARDERRRRATAPELGLTALRCLQEGAAGPSAWPTAGTGHNVLPDNLPGGPNGQAVLRLGTADQPAHVVVRPERAEWTAPLIPDAPVVLPRENLDGLHICGSVTLRTGLVRSLLLQLAAQRIHADVGADECTGTEGGVVVCFGDPEDLPVVARFLPRTVLVADTQLLEAWLRGCPVTLFILGNPTAAEEVLSRRQVDAAANQPIVIWAAESVHGTAHREVCLTPSGGTLRTDDAALSFQPDLLGAVAFERAARQLGRTCIGAGRPAAERGLAATPHLSLPALTVPEIRRAWESAAGAESLTAVIGHNDRGDQGLDLVSDGPHVLIAGTTGSGKSELLRALILSLALRYSPNEVTFLLIDFKGGSGLLPLAGMPHAAGLLTDLSTENVSRALVSLRAEVKRRESLFRQAAVADLMSYRSAAASGKGPRLPRLVLVIDEFRMLSEEVPGAVGELMRLATIGRSLGIHLVMATQRPQGSISMDIRANVTTRIALRVQNAAESLDVIDSPAAAEIPVSLPGRGYLRVGNNAAVEFQTAAVSVAFPAVSMPSRRSPSGIYTLKDFLQTADPAPFDDPAPDFANMGTGSNAAGAATLLDTAVAAVIEAAANIPRKELPRGHRPVLDPLPRSIPWAEPDIQAGRAGDHRTVHLGILDIPERQDQPRLCWHPDRHSHLALVGAGTSGLPGVLLNVVGQWARLNPVHHLYILDGDAALIGLSGSDAVGAYVAADDPARAVRVIQRLAREVSTRLAARSGTADGSASDQQACAPLALIVTGWGRWSSAIRSGRWAWAEDALQDIVRDGEKSGIVVLVAGERELVTSRFYPLIPNRIMLPAGSSAESLLAWPTLPPMERIPGRAFVQGRVGTDSGNVGQLVQAPPSVLTPLAEGVGGNSRMRSPFRIEPLPSLVHSRVLIPSQAPVRHPGRGPVRSPAFPFGVTGDELEIAQLVLPRQSICLILGGQGSGKTNLLRVLRSQAAPDVMCKMPEDPLDSDFWTALASQPCSGSVLERTILLVDDADRLSPDVHRQLADLHFAGASVVLTATSGHSLTSRGVLAAQSRLSSCGMVLAPGSATDGDFFGRRLDVEGRYPPGRAFQLLPGGIREVQVALADQLERVA